MRKLSQIAALLAAASLPVVSHAAQPHVTQVITTAPTQGVDFEIYLPLRNKVALQSLLTAQQAAGSPGYHQWLTPAQFGAQFGPTSASMANVEAAARTAGLTVTAVHTRSIHVTGSVAQVNKFFQTTLRTLTYSDGHSRMQAASLMTPPAALKQEGAVVPAFARLPEAHSDSVQAGAISPNSVRGPFGQYFADDMKQAYNYPSYATRLPGNKRLDGSGTRVAVLMADLAENSDLQIYFNNDLGGVARSFTQVTGLPTPTIRVLDIDGGGVVNGPGSVEASLDVEMVTGGAPGSAVTLVDVPDLGFDHIADGYTQIVESNQWDLVNSSFGACELAFLPSYNSGVDYTSILDTFDELFQQGNAEGITFVASSGDSAGLSCPNVGYFFGQKSGNTFVASVEWPADDPNVTAVGGGNLKTSALSPSLQSTYVAENAVDNPEKPYDVDGLGANVSGGAWGAGGGRSAVFVTPGYQLWTALNNKGSGRIVPDVGMQVGGCPGGISVLPCPAPTHPGVSAVIVVENGGFFGVIGTSVSSPEFVGALALQVEATGGRLGNINPTLWNLGHSQDNLGGANAPAVAQFFHKGQVGNDGVFTNTSTVGFDYMYGNGSPNVRTLFSMTGFAPAGIPNTSTNP